MSNHFDVLVVGLGAHGSSALYQLSKTGLRVGGIDRFSPPHSRGSSHGQSRIIRQAYFESPFYVPLLKEAYRYWAEIERESARTLYLRTGGLMLGTEQSTVVRGALESARLHGIVHELIDAREINRRFPLIRPKPDTVAVVEKDGGILFPEACLSAFLDGARTRGAVVCEDEKVIGIRSDQTPVVVITTAKEYTTNKLVVAAGAWIGGLLPELQLPLVVKRQALFWFNNGGVGDESLMMPGSLPIFIWEQEDSKMFYGFPDLGDGLKIAPHHGGSTIDPDELTNDVGPQEIADMSAVAAAHFNINPQFNYAMTCMYTNTPDEHFIIDHHPNNQKIIIASACSGHGFKFSSYTGKILADMVTGNPITVDLFPFRLSRFKS